MSRRVSHETTRIEMALRVDSICDQFENEWNSGKRPVMEAFLELFHGNVDKAKLFEELLAIELERRVALEEIPRVDEYLTAYPDYASLIQETFTSRQQIADQFDTRGFSQSDRLSAIEPGSEASEGARVECETTTPGPRYERIGKYVITALVDAGGQGEVFRAIHPLLPKELIVKLDRRVIVDAKQRNHLVEEGKILAALEHPYIARVYDLDVHEGRPFLVLEFVRGCNLKQLLKSRRLSHYEFAELMAKVASALHYAHRQGVVHLDIKPQNILIDEDGEPRLIDFGLARLRCAWTEDAIQFGTVSGTVAYMPPEQARGEVDALDARSDIFSLGAVLYEFLAGQPPFSGGDVYAELEKARRCDFDRTALKIKSIPPQQAAICLKAMSAEREARFATAEEMARQLASFVRRPKRLQRYSVVGSVILIAATVLAALLAAWPKQDAVRTNQATGAVVTPPVAGVPSTPHILTNSIGMNLVLIAAGEFLMGAPDGDAPEHVRPQHLVRISKRFYMGAYEVTVAQYTLFTGETRYRTAAERDGIGGNWVDANGTLHSGTGLTWSNTPRETSPNHPVVLIDHRDAQTFCVWLSQKENRRYRLPTEAEWEYACRAGSTTPFCFGADETDYGEYGWDRENSGYTTHPVGLKKPNPWGLYDVHGNAWEWVADWYGTYSDAPIVDPNGPAFGLLKVLRGGSYYQAPTSSYGRNSVGPVHRDTGVSFRVVLETD